MSATLIPQMLDVGLAAIQLASCDGVRLRVTHVALGDAGYIPTADQVGLRHEIVRYPIADGKTVGPRQLHLTALADDSAEFWVREVGFVLENGALLAVWSDPNRALAYKQAGLELLLAYDLTLAGVPPDSVVVQSTGAGLNLHLAEELASLACAAVVGMQADLQQDALLADHSRALTASETERANQFAALNKADQQTTQRLDLLASVQTAAHNSLLALQAANAAAIVDLQNHYLKGATT
ncbi:phage tail protein [Chromobacterium violaceum]|uniref:phage tail-collar fiber domain-containing protein n=1 Tax=Chromobacterium violaceum TaxID=536 RepID=UPI001B32CBCE|nr:phage tail protein [Chromobacterium violaceum]MBP4049245.1 phage tail protein [Chromobacterium violaceum]